MNKAAIIIFPGTNRETDMQHALQLCGFQVSFIFCDQSEIPADIDLVALPGGFSYGDYLRCGAMAANTAIIPSLKKFADQGGKVIGVCNGFQVLCEIGLLPGCLMHNQSGRFLCTTVNLQILSNKTIFTSHYADQQVINIPIAHGEGNYFADDVTLKRLEHQNQIIFKYTNNPNGSCADIAGIINPQGNVLGMMPHPENHVDSYHKNIDGLGIFQSLKYHQA